MGDALNNPFLEYPLHCSIDSRSYVFCQPVAKGACVLTFLCCIPLGNIKLCLEMKEHILYISQGLVDCTSVGIFSQELTFLSETKTLIINVFVFLLAQQLNSNVFIVA